MGGGQGVPRRDLLKQAKPNKRSCGSGAFLGLRSFCTREVGGNTAEKAR